MSFILSFLGVIRARSTGAGQPKAAAGRPGLRNVLLDEAPVGLVAQRMIDHGASGCGCTTGTPAYGRSYSLQCWNGLRLDCGAQCRQLAPRRRSASLPRLALSKYSGQTHHLWGPESTCAPCRIQIVVVDRRTRNAPSKGLRPYEGYCDQGRNSWQCRILLGCRRAPDVRFRRSFDQRRCLAAETTIKL
jgi:hypothetical protein